MKFKPSPKTGGVSVELGAKEVLTGTSSAPGLALFKLAKILIPVDFSDCSKKAFEYAVPFAKQFGATLHLLYVIEPYPAVPEMAPYDTENIQDGRRELEALGKGIGDVVPCRTLVRAGFPATEIAQAAKDVGADLIIISTHGRKGLSRLFLGSTTERVVRSAPCPVLIVREREHEFVSDACSCSMPQ